MEQVETKVDVLAVLARHASLADQVGCREQQAEAHAVFDAITKLIEAARRANGDHTAPHDCYATGPLTGDPYRDLVECPGCVLKAALANVGGGK